MINPHIVRKTTSPVAAPPEAGIHWINTTSNTSYFSVGTSSINDWVPTQGTDSLRVQVKNITGVTIPVGSVVYITGASGNLPTIALARANVEATSSKTFGITIGSIANNATGEVVVYGNISNINTNAFTEGVQLYLSPSVAGELTATKPTAPNHVVSVAICTRAHPTLGVLVVAIKNGFQLEELHNVLITSVADGQLIKYESATSLWKNVTPNYAFNNGDLGLTNEYKITTNNNGEYPLILWNRSPDFISGLICIDDTESSSLIVGVIGSNGSVSAPLDVGDAYIATANDIVFDTGANIYFTELSTEVASITTGGVFTANSIDALPINILGTPAITSADKRSSILYTDYTTGLNKSTKLEELPTSNATLSLFTNMNSPLYVNTAPSALLTGTALETVVASFLIPANTLSAFDIIRFKTLLFKNIGTLGSKTYAIKGNTINSLTGAYTIGAVAATATILTVSWERTAVIDSGNLLSTNTNGITDLVFATSTFISNPFSVTVNNYILITAKLSNTADSIQLIAAQVDRK
jgi:hypothetical protein